MSAAKRALAKRTFHDVDALAPARAKGAWLESELAVNHVTKRQRVNKDEAVVFDPAAHKEFLTGFGKRKKARRQKALKELEQKHKREHLQGRAEKRAKFKEQLGLGDNYGVEDSDSGSDAEQEEAKLLQRAAVRTYQDAGNGLTTTVTTVALDSDGDEKSDLKQNEDSDDDGGGDDVNGAAAHHQQQQQHHPQEAAAASNGVHNSKSAARLAKLKLKLKPQKHQGHGGGKGKGGGKGGGKGPKGGKGKQKGNNKKRGK